MDSNFEEFVGELQERLWLGYSKTVIDHAQNPRNVGRISNPDGYGSVTGACGDTMQIWLRVRDDTISNATFWTDGCGTTIAAGSMITELAKGRNITEAQKISPDIILNALEGLPEESQHCTVLASETLNAAVRSYLAIARKSSEEKQTLDFKRNISGNMHNVGKRLSKTPSYCQNWRTLCLISL